MAGYLQEQRAANSYCIETQRRICSEHLTIALDEIFVTAHVGKQELVCCHEIVHDSFRGSFKGLEQWLI